MSPPNGYEVASETAVACGYVNAAQARLVDQIAVALNSGAWQVGGVHRPEQWVAWQCGLSRQHARTLVETAMRVDELPVTFGAFRRGELSVDQVAAVARRIPDWADVEACDLAKVLTEGRPQVHDFSRGSRAARGEAPSLSHPAERMGGMCYWSTNCAVYSAKYHMIWCPRYRRRVLIGEVEQRLKEIISEVVAEHGATVIEVEVMPAHVHLLAEVPPTVALPVLVKALKGRSSRLLRQEFPWLCRLPSLWTCSWLVSTVGGVPLEVVRQYVENQKQAA